MNTEKKEYKYKYYDEKGNLDNSVVRKKSFYAYLASTMSISSLFTYQTYIETEKVNYPMFNSPSNTLHSLEIMTNSLYTSDLLLNSSIFTAYSIAIIGGASYLVYKNYKNMKSRADIQKKLHQMGLGQYHLSKIDKKTNEYYFSLDKEGSMAYDRFLSNADNIKQLFGVGKLKSSRNETDKVVLTFLSSTPELSAIYKGTENKTIEEMDEMISDGADKKDFKIQTNCERTDFKESMGADKCIFGVQDIEGKPLYASFPQTTGFFQGHMLIAGGTGSGKSFLMSNVVKQMFQSETYKTLDGIFAINMKEDSSDWDFLKGIDKARVGSGLEDALSMLKEAELKMLANNRWNSLNGEDNTNFGQFIVIVDEIHKFTLIANDSTQSAYVREMAKKCIQILDVLATQSRSANLFVIGILQKATLNLISDIFRSQCTNRVLLKADTTTSYIIIDKEIQEEKMIDSKRITSGQFIYHNLQNNIMKEGFAVELVKDEDFNIDEINKLPEPEKLIKGREDTNKLIELAVIVAEEKSEDYMKKEEDKDYKKKIGSYSDRKSEKKDYWKIAEEIYNKSITDENNNQEVKEEPKKEQVEKEKIKEIKQKANLSEAIKIHSKKKNKKVVSKTELNNFLDNIENKKDDLEDKKSEIDNQIKEEPIIINTDELEAKVKAQMNAEKIDYDEDCDF